MTVTWFTEHLRSRRGTRRCACGSPRWSEGRRWRRRSPRHERPMARRHRQTLRPEVGREQLVRRGERGMLPAVAKMTVTPMPLRFFTAAAPRACRAVRPPGRPRRPAAPGDTAVVIELPDDDAPTGCSPAAPRRPGSAPGPATTSPAPGFPSNARRTYTASAKQQCRRLEDHEHQELSSRQPGQEVEPQRQREQERVARAAPGASPRQSPMAPALKKASAEPSVR